MTQTRAVSAEPQHIRISDIVAKHEEPPWSEWLFTDGRNNVEHLRIASPAAGEWDLSVVATTLMGDGVPGEGDLTDQDYSLVVVVE